MMVLDEVVDALSSSNRGACVVVWPATATGEFVGEFQVLTEKEWQRLQRDGLRLAPGVDVRDLYCFQNIAAYDGLTVRVFRLSQESHTHTRQNEGKLIIWKVQKLPVMIKTRAQVEKQIVTARNGRETNSIADKTPPRPVTVVSVKTITPEKVERKRRYVDDDLKCAVDEVRPPTKTRRLGNSKEEIRTIADSIAPQEIRASAANRDILQHTTRTHRNSGHGETTGFIAVVENSSSSGYSSEAVDDENDTSENSDGALSDEEILEQESTSVSSPIRQTKAPYGYDNRRKQTTLNATLQRVVAAGMCFHDEDHGFRASHNRLQSTSVTKLFKPLWSIWESATTRVHTILNTICGLSSSANVVAAQDSMDYDLLWSEEGGDEQRWTMFGEPSTTRPIGES